MSTPPPSLPPTPSWGQPQPPNQAAGQPLGPAWVPPGANTPPEWRTPTPPPKKGAGRKVGLGCLAVFGLLVVIGGIGAAFDKHDAGKATTAAPPASSRPPQPAHTTAPAAAPAPATTAAAAPSPSHNADYVTGQKIAVWYAAGGKDKLTAIGTDATAMGTDASAMDVNQLTADCGALKGHVRDAQAFQPIPDDEAQQHWKAALADYKKAADDCISGAASTDAAKITQSGTELSDGTTEINLATARISEITAAAQ